ncbi:YcaO-like family protein [Streptomyces pristinaespiralis]|uniref:YcaO domain-containing protein n=2 Tax=Streptomyces pristinaespiralis TaxID=38300 RepID=B5H4E3_STRE2|nr:YcaO-like family protein [Streptomyces pristinaespiralis]ALC19224.1 bacteriocin biosynthesis protein SagD [Streptomyces pristinaespiralis]EDY61704.1 conserved hypothetical protein [Streptomyces pristinaespiralis ATCC 25486]QMU17703.1 YcaO-like family protein [Streptomyces pristinaespiralis]
MNTDYSSALMEFGALVDERTGVIRRVELVKVSPNDPDVFMAYAEPCDTSALVGIAAANKGAACSPSRDRAVIRACGESIERYCSAFFRNTERAYASCAELSAAGDSYVPVEELYPFGSSVTDDGFPYDLTDGRSISWVQATSTRTGAHAFVPASCVYTPYLFDRRVEPFTHMPISTGLAAQRSTGEAIDKGILEILERDAFMIIWHNRMPVPRINASSCLGLDRLIDRLLAAESPSGPTWHINLLTLDVDVPIISAALIDPGDPPRTSFGMAANADPQRALLLALEEAALTRVLINRSRVQPIAGEPRSHTVRTLRDHLNVHASSQVLRSRLGFLTDDGPQLTFTEVCDRFPGGEISISRSLHRAGLEAFWVDVTTEDVADFGFRVVRSVVPHAQPLDNDHRYRYMGGARVFTVPARLGYRRHQMADLNPDPHPFP